MGGGSAQYKDILLRSSVFLIIMKTWVSADIFAQARSWLEYSPWVPFYVGDTAAGLWMAFKALAATAQGHYCLGQASCMQKLVEGELILDAPRSPGQQPPWDGDTYRVKNGTAVVEYKGRRLTEPIRDRGWKLQHLWHQNGRIVI